MKSKLSESQRAGIIAAYDNFKLSGMSKQKAMEATAKEWGVHWQTIRKIITGRSHGNKAIIGDIKQGQAAKIDEIVEKLLMHTNKDEIIKKLSGAQSAMAICQLIDKAMKLRGEDVTKVEVKEVGEKIEKRLEELQAVKEALKKSLEVPETPETN